MLVAFFISERTARQWRLGIGSISSNASLFLVTVDKVSIVRGIGLSGQMVNTRPVGHGALNSLTTGRNDNPLPSRT
ncbi:MAG: hypothetical protein DYG83_04245 [Candidatus Brocadia sp. AMX2]|nr:MAG: hypothetical protein EDM70_03355 [Candidatus Brocadia sp. AMX2]MBC6931605.1 hypothetical protein [Candidatus Brocadia sp.]MBL1169030.1 hypothetical protein [Candidatus Brocadia sp. AMX1]MCE7866031.1 hypothetical protein [Candidatus Brocadia sp. AMX2]MCQ3916626.1 hypothetical protein [Candidatus Brocadia sp.]